MAENSSPAWDERTRQILTLEDGRALGFAEFGPETGRAIFHFHGLPGSRLEGKLFEPTAYEINARVITIDRPGIGLSSVQSGQRTAIDHARDVLALASHLDVATFSVMGVSGGGPYAIACAHVIPPSQLKGVALVAGCKVWSAESAKGMSTINKWLFWGLNAAPWPTWLFVRSFYGMMLSSTDEQLLAQMKDKIGGSSWILPPPAPKDIEALSDGEMNAILIAEFREHFRNGYSAFSEDGKIITAPLPFALKECGVEKVDLWYGKQDSNVPTGIGEAYASELGGKANLRIVDETHLSLVKNYRKEILTNLLQAM